jgi:uncharacterized protein
MKNKIIITLIILTIIALSVSAFKFQQNGNIIQVSGAGKVNIEPDIAFVNVGITNTYKDVALGQKEINQSISRFLESVQEFMDKKDISTERLLINNQYEYISGRREFVGYNIQQHLKIKVKDLNNIGKIIDYAVASGLNNIGQISFSSSKVDEYKQQALKLALLNAKAKAQLIAQTMDIETFQVKFISESRNFVSPIRAEGLQMKAMSSMDEGNTNFQIGDMNLEVFINVVYDF